VNWVLAEFSDYFYSLLSDNNSNYRVPGVAVISLAHHVT
jgi:hypothetical protein